MGSVVNDYTAPRGQGLEMKMFTMENTEGFTQSDLDLMNEALAALVSDGVDESNASDIVNNNWMPSGNTVESLTAR